MVFTSIDASLVPSAQKLSQYKRPQLGYGGVTAVGLDNYRTDGINNWSQIIFPDGQWREESNTTRRTFIITRNAVLTDSGAQSGLRTGSEANNTWYALYAVKIIDSSSGFVVVGDTVQPTLANIATLNSNFGANNWSYLGMIRNGDGASAPGDIVYFIMSGNTTYFMNSIVGSYGDWMRGVRMATTGSATSLTVAENSIGTSGSVAPATWRITSMACAFTTTATSATLTIRDFDQIINYHRCTYPPADRYELEIHNFEWLNGVRINSGASTAQMDINLIGGIDDALGVGANPLI